MSPRGGQRHRQRRRDRRGLDGQRQRPHLAEQGGRAGRGRARVDHLGGVVEARAVQLVRPQRADQHRVHARVRGAPGRGDRRAHPEGHRDRDLARLHAVGADDRPRADVGDDLVGQRTSSTCRCCRRRSRATGRGTTHVRRCTCRRRRSIRARPTSASSTTTGLDLDKRSERKLEGLFFREDIRRVSHYEMGRIVRRDEQTDALHRGHAGQARPRGRARQAAFKVVIDYNNGAAAMVLPRVLQEMNCSVIPLNASPAEIVLEEDDDAFRGAPPGDGRDRRRR